MKLRPCLLLCVTIALTLLPVLAADPPDKGKGNQGKQTHVFAKLKSGGQKWELVPNVLGNFPVVITKTNSPVSVELRLPNASDGQLAVIAIRDGGSVAALVPDDSKGKGKGAGQSTTAKTLRTRVGNNRKVEFTFAYGTEFHNQRVTVQVGALRNTFEFHVDH